MNRTSALSASSIAPSIIGPSILAVSSIAACVIAVALPGAASAATVTNTINASWSAAPGTTDPITSVITLPAVASINSITVTLAHTHAGDMEIGIDASADPGFLDFDLMETPFGNSFDYSVGTLPANGSLSNAAPYTFIDAGPFDWSDPHSPPGTYNALAWLEGPLDAGDYTLVLHDNFTGHGGSIGTYTIDYTPIPAPPALALLGVAGLMSGRGRRRMIRQAIK